MMIKTIYIKNIVNQILNIVTSKEKIYVCYVKKNIMSIFLDFKEILINKDNLLKLSKDLKF